MRACCAHRGPWKQRDCLRRSRCHAASQLMPLHAGVSSIANSQLMPLQAEVELRTVKRQGPGCCAGFQARLHRWLPKPRQVLLGHLHQKWQASQGSRLKPFAV